MTASVHRCHHDNVEHVAPRAIWRRDDVGVLGQRRHRVVVQHVQPAEALDRRPDQLGDVVLLAHIGREDGDRGPEIVRKGLQTLDVEISGDDTRPLPATISRTVAAPMPLAPPVTTATLPPRREPTPAGSAPVFGRALGPVFRRQLLD